MIRSLLTLMLMLMLMLPLPLCAATWSVLPEESSLRFRGNAQGEAFDGRFVRFAPTIVFDPAALDGARFEVDIDLASVDTQNAERDETLVSEDFFAVEEQPRARYEASDFVATDDGFEARGTLTLRGVSRPVTLSFTWTPDANGATLEGRATLDRTAFGVGGGDWADADMIAHAVEVMTTLVLRPGG